MPRWIKLFLLSIRDLFASAGPVAILVAAVLVGAYWWLDPQPPRRLVLATGPEGSAYAAFGERYRAALATDGITVELRATGGAADNLALLRSGEADAAFVRGGIADTQADGEAGITSLGALFYEPIWVFYRAALVAEGSRPASSLAQLRGLRVNVDAAGSGVPAVVERLLAANNLKPQQLRLSSLPADEAARALAAGRLDVVLLASAPESTLVQKLLHAPGVRLMDFGQADAYARRFAFLQAVTLPRGVADLAADLPPQDVSMLAATTSLLAREQTHPALRQLLAQAAQKLHGGAGWFNRARDFPNTRTSELPVSPEGDRAINGTPPFWQRYLPFWASNLVERMWLVLGGLIVLLLPLSRIVPPLYAHRVRSRVFRWYATLRAVESDIEAGTGDAASHAAALDRLEAQVEKVSVPLAYTDELYALRNHIHLVRRRLNRPRGDTSTGV